MNDQQSTASCCSSGPKNPLVDGDGRTSLLGGGEAQDAVGETSSCSAM
ncbi:hypothetical protein [Microbacterium sp.]